MRGPASNPSEGPAASHHPLGTALRPATGLLSAVRGDLLRASAPEESQAFPSLQRKENKVHTTNTALARQGEGRLTLVTLQVIILT